MPTIRLTQLAVSKLAPPQTGRVVYWDRTLPGFGLRVTAAGAISWICKTRVGTKQIFETLGTLAQVPKVEDARELARASQDKAARGVNAATNTVKAAVERYLAHCDRALKPKTAAEWRRIFAHDVLPAWSERPLAEISKGDVLELVNDKAAMRERKRKGTSGGAAI